MRHIDYVVKCIQRALAKVEKDPFTPAALSSEIPDYLVDLTVRYPDDGSEFSKFVISLRFDAIENELLKEMLPENVRQVVLEHRTEHGELQTKLESAVFECEFRQAARYRDQRNEVMQSIRDLVADQDFTISPALVESALRSLGYNGP